MTSADKAWYNERSETQKRTARKGTKQMQAVIYDNLKDRCYYTIECKTDEEAKQKAIEKIARLCKIYKIDITDGRFILTCIEH